MLNKIARIESEIEEADRLLDLPHPREMLDFVGHKDSEIALLEAYKSGRMHHGWIFGGQEGIGKATLAYRFARFVLAHGDPTSADVQTATTLHVPENHRIAHLIAAQSHPDLFALRRNWNHDSKKLRTEIQVDDVRKLVAMFQSTASFGGWRVAIIDAAEDLNASSANALLKILEEPPVRSLFIIISHEPGRLLPTIRSRCRMLPIRPLEELQVMALMQGLSEIPLEADILAQAAARSSGSMRRAFALMDGNAPGFRSRMDSLLQNLPQIDEKTLLAIADETTKKDSVSFESFLEAIEDYLHNSIKARTSQGAATLVAFANVAERLSRARKEVDAYNLDRRPLVLTTITDIADAVRRAG